jgi:hypothetical protein
MEANASRYHGKAPDEINSTSDARFFSHSLGQELPIG